MIIVYITIRLLGLLEWLLVFRAIASWFPQVQASKVGQLLYMVTEPMIAPCRNFLYRFRSLRTMPIDFSLLMAYFILYFAERLLYTMMYAMY